MPKVLVLLLCALLLRAQAHVGLDHVLGHSLGDDGAVLAGFGDVGADFFGGEHRRRIVRAGAGADVRVAVVHVHVGDVLGELRVGVARGRVEEEEHDVETGQEGGGEVDVLDGGEAGVVPAVERVSGGEDGGARVQGS